MSPPGDDGELSWRQLWEQTAPLIGRAEARWLCEEASGCFGDEFADALDAFASQRSVAHLDAMLARLRAGEPLQYVLGHWSCRRLDLLVDRRVLIPRPETEFVAEHAIALTRRVAGELPTRRPLLVADLGTGSGAIGLSLAAELPGGMVEVWLTDQSADAIDVARANAAGLGMAGACVRFAEGSWFDALLPELRGELALVVSNPPYIAHGDPDVAEVVRTWEPHAALYADANGLSDVRAIVDGAVDWLAEGGWLVSEIGEAQGDAVRELMTEAGFADVEVLRDFAGRDRVVVGRRVS